MPYPLLLAGRLLLATCAAVQPVYPADSTHPFTEHLNFRFDSYDRVKDSNGRIHEKYSDPFFPGGEDSLFCFLGNAMQYPATTDSGSVIMRFHISGTGQVSDVKVIKSTNPVFEPEAVRLVQSLPDWTPGIMNGKTGSPATCRLVIPFTTNRARYCQHTDAPKEQTAFDNVQPEYVGGDEALNNYLGRHIHYPRQAERDGIKGTVFVQFYVSPTGQVEDVHVVGGPKPLLDEEAVRVVRAMPVWLPGMQNGKTVRVQFTLPIRFSL